MKGCVCEKENFLTSYKDELSRVTTLHPDWSAHQVRVNVVETLRPRFRQDRAVQKMENTMPEYKVPDEFMLTMDGRAYWNGYGRYMSELNQRTKTLTPNQHFSPEDQTTRAIETALSHGATTIVTAYSRPGNDIGDMLVISYDPITNRGIMKVVNMAVDGQTHSFSKIRDIAQSRFSSLQLVQPAENVFLLTDKPKEILEHVVRDAVVSLSHATHDVVRDVGTGARALSEFLVEKIREVRRNTRKDNKQITLNNQRHDQIYAVSIKKEGVLLDTKENFPFQEKAQGHKHWKKNQQEVLRFGMISLIAVETGVGVGGSLYAMRLLVKKEKHLVKKHKEKRMLRGEGFKKAEKTRKRRAKRLERRSLHEKQVKGKKQKRIRRGITQEFLGRRKSQKEQNRYVQRKERKIKLRKRDVLSKERGLLLVLMRLTKRLNKPDVRRRHKKKDATFARFGIEQEETRKKEKKLVVRFAFAWALWLFIRLFRLQTKRIDVSKDQHKSLRKRELHTSRQSQWLLLAIIWYLAMFREQRMPVTNKKKQKKTKQKSFSRPNALPSQAVIFAFSS